QGVPPSGTYVVNAITLPYTSLAAASAGSSTSTNLGAGWSAIVTNTLISTTWNSSSNAFVSVTNTSYVTNTTFADIPIPFQKEVAIAFAGHPQVSLGNTPSNIVYTFAPILDSGTVDTVNTLLVTNAGNATNVNSANLVSSQVVGTTNLNRNAYGGYG